MLATTIVYAFDRSNIDFDRLVRYTVVKRGDILDCKDFKEVARFNSADEMKLFEEFALANKVKILQSDWQHADLKELLK